MRIILKAFGLFIFQKNCLDFRSVGCLLNGLNQGQDTSNFYHFQKVAKCGSVLALASTIFPKEIFYRIRYSTNKKIEKK